MALLVILIEQYIMPAALNTLEIKGMDMWSVAGMVRVVERVLKLSIPVRARAGMHLCHTCLGCPDGALRARRPPQRSRCAQVCARKSHMRHTRVSHVL